VVNAATESTPPNFDVRELARKGTLAQTAYELTGEDLRNLRTEAYVIALPVVFQNHTHRLEVGRRHFKCVRSFQSLEPECLDRFHDDLESVVDYLLRHATSPINNLEGWMTRRLLAATVDGYRRRRGAIGALQRPRLPGWLIMELGDDERLMRLALQMLEWVGIERTAGTSQWPLEAWAEQWTAATGDHHHAQRAVAAGVERVLTAMRSRPSWYDRFIERPMGHKQAPVAPRAHSDMSALEPAYVIQMAHAEAMDVYILEVVEAALESIEFRIGRGEDPRTVIVDVLTTAFTSGTGAEDLAERPDSGTDLSEALARRIAEPETLDRIVAVCLELLAFRLG
jgi:hypothetical protein